jgi:hypothetical protein
MFVRLPSLCFIKNDPLFAALCLSMIFLPLSNALGQGPLYAASVFGAVAMMRYRAPVRKGSFIFVAGFALLILSGLLYAVRVENVVDKLNRLLLFPLVFVVPFVLRRHGDPSAKTRSLLWSFVAGTVLLGVYDLVRIPLEVRQGTALFDTGHMVPPQVYMTAFFLLLGVGPPARKHGKLFFVLLLALFVAGMLLHNKRGVWLACLLAFGLWVFLSRQWKMLAGGVLLIVFASLLPSVRVRMKELRDVVQPTHGGRMVLWNVVAPELFEQYPWGMGYSVSEHQDFRAVIDAVNATLPRSEWVHLEDRLSHLHNNFLQIRLEMGLHGLIWWALWMAFVLWTAFRNGPKDDPSAPLRAGVACAFLALLLNGLVEYNFGASKPLMIYLVLMGLIDTHRSPEKGTASEPQA